MTSPRCGLGWTGPPQSTPGKNGVDRSTPFLPGVFMCKSAAFVLVQVILKLINFVCGISVLCVIHLTAKFQVVVQC